MHHILATARHAQRTADFYVGVLGLRLVKQTVDPDEPRLYLLYFGDAAGSPGSVIGFVIDPTAQRGMVGAGMTRSVMFAVPPNSLGFWRQQLAQQDVPFWDARDETGLAKIGLRDPDGLDLELVATTESPSWRPVQTHTVPHPYAVRGLHGIRVSSNSVAATTLLLQELGWSKTEGSGRGQRFVKGAPGERQYVLVDDGTGLQTGRPGTGTVRRVLLRVGEPFLNATLSSLVGFGVAPSEPLNRTYFEASGFEDLGGLALGLATDRPGFAVDEPVESLGYRLCLPAHLEPYRERIARLLPPLGISLR